MAEMPKYYFEREDIKMKNLNKARVANSRTLEFRNKEEMWKYLLCINEILVPYSEELIHTGPRRNDPEREFWMKKGIKIDFWDNENMVDILVKGDDFKRIEHLFIREKIRDHKCKYVFKGFEEAWA